MCRHAIKSFRVGTKTISNKISKIINLFLESNVAALFCNLILLFVGDLGDMGCESQNTPNKWILQNIILRLLLQQGSRNCRTFFLPWIYRKWFPLESQPPFSIFPPLPLPLCYHFLQPQLTIGVTIGSDIQIHVSWGTLPQFLLPRAVKEQGQRP